VSAIDIGANPIYELAKYLRQHLCCLEKEGVCILLFEKLGDSFKSLLTFFQSLSIYAIANGSALQQCPSTTQSF
jgi:hypothetical protein